MLVMTSSTMIFTGIKRTGLAGLSGSGSSVDRRPRLVGVGDQGALCGVMSLRVLLRRQLN